MRRIKAQAIWSLGVVILAVSTTWARDAAPDDWRPGAVLEVSVVQVIDGDTLRVRHGAAIVDVRLHGIDAPEWDQSCFAHNGATFACGKDATGVLVDIVGGRPTPCRSARLRGVCVSGGLPMACRVMALDTRWQRPVAKCFAGRVDAGQEMVQRGFATAAYSADYVSLGATARLRKNGLWAGQFDDPGVFRRRGIEGR